MCKHQQMSLFYLRIIQSNTINWTVKAATATTVYTAPALYLVVNTAVTNGTCDITVFGDVVTL